MFFDDTNIIDLMINNDEKLVDDKLGLARGNLFKDEYVPYKDIEIREIVPRNEMEELLLKIYETDFAIKDLNLYLDLYPNDNKLYDKFKTYVEKNNEYKSNYEKKYGPLCLDNVTSSTYKWISNPWPWDQDRGGVNV